MHKKTPKLLTVSAIALSLLLTATPSVLAQSVRANQNTGLQKANTRAEQRVIQKPIETQAQNEDSQKSCEARQSAVVNRMERLLAMTENMQTVFDAHSQRIQSYYLTVLVPAGITISNYDTLLADIAAQKAVVQTTIATAQASTNGFSCEISTPKMHLDTFRTDIVAVKSALKDYRISIKDLLVEVRTAAEYLHTTTE